MIRQRNAAGEWSRDTTTEHKRRGGDGEAGVGREAVVGVCVWMVKGSRISHAKQSLPGGDFTTAWTVACSSDRDSSGGVVGSGSFDQSSSNAAVPTNSFALTGAGRAGGADASSGVDPRDDRWVPGVHEEKGDKQSWRITKATHTDGPTTAPLQRGVGGRHRHIAPALTACR